MDNLFFCLNATGPIFLMMILGLFFRHIGWMDEEFASKMNKFVFKVPLPLLLFGDLAMSSRPRRSATFARSAGSL